MSNKHGDKIVAIIQARMGASRLPNKMMLWLHGFPVAEWVYRRVSSSSLLSEIVFALPDRPADQLLADFLTRRGALVFQGAEQDVLGRFYNAAKHHDADIVIRICADNPFVSGSEIDRLIRFCQEGDYDYAYNHIPRDNKYPDGLGAEIAPMSILHRLHETATEPSHREHLFNYIWDHREMFRIATCDPDDLALAQPHLKLDLDTIDDYARLLRLNVHPDMTAGEIVAAALAEQTNRNRS